MTMDNLGTDLHKCFGVISYPLLEVAALLKAMESGEWRC